MCYSTSHSAVIFLNNMDIIRIMMSSNQFQFVLKSEFERLLLLCFVTVFYIRREVSG